MLDALDRYSLASRRAITVPLLRPAIASIGVLSLMLLLSSFEIEVFLGTSSGIFVLTNRIYKYLQEILPADYPAAFSLSLLLLVLPLALLAVLRWPLGAAGDHC